jgi:hypothetical protein
MQLWHFNILLVVNYPKASTHSRGPHSPSLSLPDHMGSWSSATLADLKAARCCAKGRIPQYQWDFYGVLTGC